MLDDHPATRPMGWERSARLVGTDGMDRLARARVVVVGLGGVGSMAAEALARSGVGGLRLVDHDTIGESNGNRQLHAFPTTVGAPKAAVMADRLAALPHAGDIAAVPAFVDADTAADLVAGHDVVVDAIDSLGPKVSLLATCVGAGIPVISAQGAAGRTDPTAVRVMRLDRTAGDPLAAQVRKRLRRLEVDPRRITAACSIEPPVPAAPGPWSRMTDDLHRGRQRMVQPSMMMVPGAMGLAMAAWVVRRLSAPTATGVR